MVHKDLLAVSGKGPRGGGEGVEQRARWGPA